MELHKLTIHEAKALLKRREITSKELTNAFIQRIQHVDKKVKAFITLDTGTALRDAEKVQIDLNFGKTEYDLAGIPMGLSDNICTKGLRTTCASRMLYNFIPPYDATVTKKIRSQMGIILGKLNMDEFAMGSSTENSAIQKTYNPWELSRVPGGSSGGAAASVAANEIPYSLASDADGSIRLPASFCGLVGLKPTYGSVSRFGLISNASSLEQIGPITKDVADCALVFNAISGYDDLDSTSVKIFHPDYTGFIKNNIKGLKIGIPKECFIKELDPEVKNAFENALKTFEKHGAYVEEFSLSSTKYALMAYFILASAEASSNLSRYDGVKYGYRAEKTNNLKELYTKTRSSGFGLEAKRRIMLGNYVLSSNNSLYKKAIKARNLICRDYDDAFKRYDIIATPTCPFTAFKIGELLDNPIGICSSNIYTVPINIAGLPAITVPCGYDSRKLPIGLQLIAKHFNESNLFRAAYAFEQQTDYHLISPLIDRR